MTATREFPLAFESVGERLLGIVSTPTQPADVGVVIVVGGPQYRAGSHRQFVTLARALAGAGHAVLRFDTRGMGDSSGAQRSFEDAGADIGAAIDALLAAQPQLRRVVLWGLCDGASAALLALPGRPDPRIAGLALLNPWVRSESSLAKTHVKHYYLRRLRQREFWLKLASGKVAVAALAGLVGNLRTAWAGNSGAGPQAAPFQDRMARAWAAFPGQILLLLSEDDITAREFSEVTAAGALWQLALRRRPPTRVLLPDADHTCSSAAAQRAVEQATAQWLRQVVTAAR